MRKNKILSVLLSAVLCLGCFAGCGKEKNDSSSTDKRENDNSSSTLEKEKTSEIGELITPDKDSEEYDLGSYRISENGVKLYYEDSEYPTELVSTLEKYFTSFETGDYESYKECIFPSYIETMEKYLQENYQYGLDKSFQTQCDNLKTNMGGDFEITRIKVEKPVEVESEETGADEFLDNLDGFFGQNYKESVKNDCDSLRYMTFSVMAKDAEGTESLLVSGFYILFAEKDDKYYTFG